jgi:hypothetical protein
VNTRTDRRIRVALGSWASLAFLVLWVGVALNLVHGGRLAGDAWSWLAALPGALQLVVSVLVLPVTIGLWVSEADVPTFVEGAVVLGLVAWTGVAWFGLLRILQTRRRA